MAYADQMNGLFKNADALGTGTAEGGNDQNFPNVHKREVGPFGDMGMGMPLFPPQAQGTPPPATPPMGGMPGAQGQAMSGMGRPMGQPAPMMGQPQNLRAIAAMGGSPMGGGMGRPWG